MKKIILGSLIVSALFLSGCSSKDSVFYKFPSNTSYTFDVKSSGEITSMGRKTYDSENKRVVSEVYDIELVRDEGKDYRETIQNPVRSEKEADRSIIKENEVSTETKVIYNEDKPALLNIGFVLYSYSGFDDPEYKFMYELDCDENTNAQENKISNYYIFSKTYLDVISSSDTTAFTKDDKKSHICIDRSNGTIYLVTNENDRPNFCIIQKGEDDLAPTSGFNTITVSTPDEKLKSGDFINVVIKNFTAAE